MRGETDAPALVSLEARADRKAGKATITVKAADDSGVSEVTLYHKPIPSEKTWEPLIMEPSGDGFTAEVPLTPSGLQYYVEAVDIYGNAKVYPDFLVETPYRTIDSWPLR